MIVIAKGKKKYFFKKNNTNILTKNGFLLEVNKKKHAELILTEIFDKKKLENPYSVINLTLYSCNLDKKGREEIKLKIIELLNFDLVLYRCFEEEDLNEMFNEKFKEYISDFQQNFNIKLSLINSIVEYNNLKSHDFEIFLNSLDNFKLTVLFKLSALTKSVILSFNFLIQKIDHNSLYKLSNLEYTYQQRRWGLVKEQKLINENNFLLMKNISFFFKNTI